MRRSNALKLRHFSSTATTRTQGFYHLEKSSPVGAKEFKLALADVVPWRWGSESRRPIGLAISGGVDSMALAALYHRARMTNSFLPNPHGLIVDHKVRPESTEEAKWVAQQLHEKFGMESTILPITWAADFDPSDTRRFETEARTMRYQTLGRACRNKFSHLMVAHHADDQAETIMMRLANNRLRSGLQGMQSVEWIPECDGIYGVHHSGIYKRQKANLNIPFPVVEGGIQILRPLLSFEKARLVATCEENGVAWAEDRTNQVQTLTARNAIRHIYKNHQLPRALSIKSLINLSLSMQKRVDRHRSDARELFEQTLIKLDIQTSSLVVRFPPYSALLHRPIKTESDKSEARNNAYCLIERVAEMVAPKSKAPLGQLAATIERIYPAFESIDPEHTDEMENQRANYCVFNVWWQVWTKSSPFPAEPGTNPSYPHPREWFLTRQPLDVNEQRDSANHIAFPPAAPSSHSTPTPRATYQLFDGRFWIRIRNQSSDTLVLRLFSKNDMTQFPTVQQEKAALRKMSNSVVPHAVRPHRFISAAFDLLRPTDLRFTLPALFRLDATTGKETLLGFPTLDVRMHGFGAPHGVCEWSVLYKKIDFGKRDVADIVVPGTTKKDVIAEEKRGRLGHRGVVRLHVDMKDVLLDRIKEKLRKGLDNDGRTVDGKELSSGVKRVEKMW